MSFCEQGNEPMGSLKSYLFLRSVQLWSWPYLQSSRICEPFSQWSLCCWHYLSTLSLLFVKNNVTQLYVSSYSTYCYDTWCTFLHSRTVQSITMKSLGQANW